MTKNNPNLTLAILSIAGGTLSSLAWFPWCTGLVLPLSFVPFFLIARLTEPDHKRFGNRILFIRVLPGFLMFNAIALFWIRIAGIPLLVTVITGNTFMMAFTFWLSWIVRQKTGRFTGNATFILFWLTMEYATNNISFLSPWMNLGNGLAKETSLIQWYEFTGVAGGTFWILVSNMTIASVISSFMERREGNKSALITSAALIISLPPLISLLMNSRAEVESGQLVEVVIIQPCKDPYTEKFNTGFTEQLDTMLSMAQRAASEKTSWFITPETAIHDPINLTSIESDIYIAAVKGFLTEYPESAFLLGAVTFREGPGESLHNSAILITSDGVKGIYHKSRLVPGIERSFSGLSSFLQRFFPELGGTTGGYTGQDSPTLLKQTHNGTAIGPVICFESAFGEHVTHFVRSGADIIAVITNDGWWKGTNGYYQHLTFSSLRAIETRRPVLRAANTGVSAIIDADGKVRKMLPWWEKGTITDVVSPAIRITFYVKYGDLISRTATSLTLFIIIIHLLALPLRRKISEQKF